MIHRFQFSLSTLIWAMFAVAILSGSWQIARYWLSGPFERTFDAVIVSGFLLAAADSFVNLVTQQQDSSGAVES